MIYLIILTQIPIITLYSLQKDVHSNQKHKQIYKCHSSSEIIHPQFQFAISAWSIKKYPLSQSLYSLIALVWSIKWDLEIYAKRNCQFEMNFLVKLIWFLLLYFSWIFWVSVKSKYPNIPFIPLTFKLRVLRGWITKFLHQKSINHKIGAVQYFPFFLAIDSRIYIK